SAPRRRWSGRTVLVAAAAAIAIVAVGIVAGITVSHRSEPEPSADRQTPIASTPPSRPTQAPPSSPSSPPTTAPMSLTGRWSGAVSGDQSGFDVVADIVDKPPLTATVSYPQLNCGGTWTQHGSAGNGVRFVTENITYGSCVQSEVTVTPQDDGTLYFSSTYYSVSRQRNLTINATLRR
ncbi:MAG: serine/threonine protein kinase, partial [Mycobacterium sp.]